MNVFYFCTGPVETNTYIFSSANTHDAVIVDPGVGSYDTLVKEIKEKSLNPIAIWLTHSHWDHIGDAAKLKREFSIPIYVHHEDRENLENPGSDGVPMMVPKFEGVMPDHLIEDGEQLVVGDITFSVIHTPGHTPGGVCFYSEKEKTLISGDTVYQQGIGALNMSTSEPERMWLSLDKLSNLPLDTKVFPGHGPETTLKDEPWIHNARNHPQISLPTHVVMVDSRNQE